MKDWQFNVLFVVGVGGAVLLLFAPELGLDLSKNPTAVGGLGAILAYVLTQRETIVRKKKNSQDSEEDSEEDEEGEGGEE